MTIGRGRTWGTPGVLASDGIVVESDAEASEALGAARAAGTSLPMIGLTGGDLCRTLGGTGSRDRLYGAEARRFPVDLGIASVDGAEHVFVAHVIVHSFGWRGRTVAVMNAQWYGTWDVAPKSHPDDARLDVTDAQLSLADRLAARRRLPTGTHVPHPDITLRRTREWSATFARPRPVRVDGKSVGRVRELSVHLEPDAVTVVI